MGHDLFASLIKVAIRKEKSYRCLSVSNGETQISTEDILLAICLQENSAAGEILNKIGLDLAEIKNQLSK